MENLDENQISSSNFTPSNYVGTRWAGGVNKPKPKWILRGDKNQDKKFRNNWYLLGGGNTNPPVGLKSYLMLITGKQ